MKFYNRKRELEELSHFIDLIKGKSAMIIVSGRRRVGKTRLVKEALRNKVYLDFFFPVKEKGLILEEFSNELKGKLGYAPHFDNFDGFLEYIFKEKDKICIFFDEFQNMAKVDQGFFYSLQKYWDRYKDEKNFILLVSGSYIGTMKKIFQDKKAPLYGRADAFFKILPLEMPEAFRILDDLKIKGIQEKLMLYGMFGGIPKYYEYMENVKSRTFFEMIRELFIEENSLLVYEGKSILIEEFGKRYKMYFSILESIAKGKNTITEIANLIRQKPNTIIKHLIVLEDYFEILKRRYPVTEKKSKKSRYILNDYFLNFWFRFIQRNINLIEENRKHELFEIIKNNFNEFFGNTFEDIIKEILIISNKKNKLPFSFVKIGKWWGHYRDKETNERKEIEIDLAALNEKTKQILFAECKWKDKANTVKILADLKEKAAYVNWHNGKRKEHYAIFAKSFKRRISEKNVYLYDLNDIERLFG